MEKFQLEQDLGERVITIHQYSGQEMLGGFLNEDDLVERVKKKDLDLESIQITDFKNQSISRQGMNMCSIIVYSSKKGVKIMKDRYQFPKPLKS